MFLNFRECKSVVLLRRYPLTRLILWISMIVKFWELHTLKEEFSIGEASEVRMAMYFAQEYLAFNKVKEYQLKEKLEETERLIREADDAHLTADQMPLRLVRRLPRRKTN